jgi:hypothetical protein
MLHAMQCVVLLQLLQQLGVGKQHHAVALKAQHAERSGKVVL